MNLCTDTNLPLDSFKYTKKVTAPLVNLKIISKLTHNYSNKNNFFPIFNLKTHLSEGHKRNLIKI